MILISHKKQLLGAFFMALFIYTIFLRFYKLGNDDLWIDEGITIMQSEAVAKNGYMKLPSGNIEYKDFLYPYIYAGISVLSEKNIVLFRIVSVFFGTASILLIFLLGRLVFSREAGAIAAILMAFSYWHIAWSRQARGYVAFIFFMFLTLYFLVMSERSGNKNRYLILSFVALFFLTMAKSNFALLFLPAIVFFIFKKSLPRIYFFFIFLITAISLYFSSSLLKNIDIGPYNYFSFYVLSYYWEYFGLAFLFAISGAYLAISESDKDRQMHIAIILTLIIPLLFFSFFSYINQRRYLFVTTPILFLYSTNFCIYLSKLFKPSLQRLALLVIISSLVLSDKLIRNAYVLKPEASYALEFFTPQPPFRKAYESISGRLDDMVIVSPYPYMDGLYLGKSDYALDISYTGKSSDSSLKNGKERYTGTPGIMTAADLAEVQKKSAVAVLLDAMGEKRVPTEVTRYIKDHSETRSIFEKDDGQYIYLYQLPLIK